MARLQVAYDLASSVLGTLLLTHWELVRRVLLTEKLSVKRTILDILFFSVGLRLFIAGTAAKHLILAAASNDRFGSGGSDRFH